MNDTLDYSVAHRDVSWCLVRELHYYPTASAGVVSEQPSNHMLQGGSMHVYSTSAGHRVVPEFSFQLILGTASWNGNQEQVQASQRQ